MPRIPQLPLTTQPSLENFLVVYEIATGKTVRAPVGSLLGAHTHVIADVTGLQGALNAKQSQSSALTAISANSGSLNISGLDLTLPPGLRTTKTWSAAGPSRLVELVNAKAGDFALMIGSGESSIVTVQSGDTGGNTVGSSVYIHNYGYSNEFYANPAGNGYPSGGYSQYPINYPEGASATEIATALAAIITASLGGDFTVSVVGAVVTITRNIEGDEINGYTVGSVFGITTEDGALPTGDIYQLVGDYSELSNWLRVYSPTYEFVYQSGGNVTVPGTVYAPYMQAGTVTAVTALEGPLNCSYLQGTINDARLSSNVALLAGTQTFTGSKTFSANATLNGPSNVAPNHTAYPSSATTVMTREQSDLWGLFECARVRRVQFVGCTRLQSGTGASTTYLRGNVDVRCGSVAASWGAIWLASPHTSHYGGSGAGTFYSKKIRFSALFIPQHFATNVTVRFVQGAQDSVAPTFADQNALTDKGFGVDIRHNGTSVEFRLFAHNGTTYVTSSAVTYTPSPGYVVALVVESDGAGTIRLYHAAGLPPAYPSTTATITLTGGPTGLPAVYQNSMLGAFAVAHSTNAPTATSGGSGASLLLCDVTLSVDP